MAQPLKDFGNVVKALFRFARTASYALTAVVGVWIFFQCVSLVRAAGSIHPVLAYVAALAIGVALWLAVARPLIRFFRLPLAIQPPRLPPREARRARDLVRHLEFAERYVRAVGRNPEWTGDAGAVEAAAAACRALRGEVLRSRGEGWREVEPRIAALERGTIGALLASLDRKATDAIRAEAVGVGVATAISPTGRMDAFIVLWRACNLISRIAAIYYGRPGVRGTLAILRDVSAATIASAYLDDLSDLAGGMVGAIAGKTAGALAGPLLDGSLNAVGVVRVGYIAKARCRAFVAWTERTRADAARAALKEAAAISSGIVMDLVKTVGGGVLKLPVRLLQGLTQAVASWFRPPEPEPGPG